MMGDSSPVGSWMDAFREYPVPSGVSRQQLRSHTVFVDEALLKQWNLGRNIILLWAENDKSIDLLVVPYYLIVDFAESAGERTIRLGNSTVSIYDVLSGPKLTTATMIEAMAKVFGVTLQRLQLPFHPESELGHELISALVHRYSITLVHERAVALFDIVGFALLSPLEQVTQLNSLSYSLNKAYSILLEREIVIEFSRTTTGDGFYIWNRATHIQANIDLFYFMQLTLADNAIAYQRSKGRAVPKLRSCIHVGPHYEYYQAVGLSPTTYSYIVGDVTIELARMIEHSRPNQVLVGDFNIQMTNRKTGEKEWIDSAELIYRAQESGRKLAGVILSDDEVEAIRFYLTGVKQDDGTFGISRYRVTDKHGLSRNVFNAKINIHRKHGSPLFLGIQESELSDFADVEGDKPGRQQ